MLVNSCTFSSIKQQTEEKTRDLDQEMNDISKSKGFWIVFWIAVLSGWSVLLFVSGA